MSTFSKLKRKRIYLSCKER